MKGWLVSSCTLILVLILVGILEGPFLQTAAVQLVTKKLKCFSLEVKIIAVDGRFLLFCCF